MSSDSDNNDNDGAVKEEPQNVTATHESTVPSTAPSQKHSIVTLLIDEPETTIKFSTEPPTIINLEQPRPRKTNLNPKGILKNAIKHKVDDFVAPDDDDFSNEPSFSQPSRGSIRGSLA